MGRGRGRQRELPNSQVPKTQGSDRVEREPVSAVAKWPAAALPWVPSRTEAERQAPTAAWEPDAPPCCPRPQNPYRLVGYPQEATSTPPVPHRPGRPCPSEPPPPRTPRGTAAGAAEAASVQASGTPAALKHSSQLWPVLKNWGHPLPC